MSLAGERRSHSLEPTALAHEAWLRLVPESARRAAGRSHFMAMAARAMRQILVDHARARARHKRGGGEWQRVSFSALPHADSPQAALDDVLDLDRALSRLAETYPRCARIVELRAFGGLTIDEAAKLLGVSHVTVEDDWALAKAWLSRSLRTR